MKSSAQATRIKSYTGKLEGWVSVVSPLELNAVLTGESLAIKRFNQGDKVRYVGSNENLKRHFAGVELTVNETLASDPRWVNCTYIKAFSRFGVTTDRQEFTPWLKGEDLRLID